MIHGLNDGVMGNMQCSSTYRSARDPLARITEEIVACYAAPFRLAEGVSYPAG